jgi:hypothetical protein
MNAIMKMIKFRKRLWYGLLVVATLNFLGNLAIALHSSGVI